MFNALSRFSLNVFSAPNIFASAVFNAPNTLCDKDEPKGLRQHMSAQPVSSVWASLPETCH